MALLEVCVDSIEALLRAQRGGADRIELCSRLDLGGLSPLPALLEAARDCASVPLHVMVRPRGGDFVYDGAEFEAMKDEVAALREAGVAGVVFGILTRNRAVDLVRTQTLARSARPMSVTFHRAFDQTRDLLEAIDDLVAAGVDRVLTSGGAKDAFEGRSRIRSIVERARGRIVVMAGGGVRSSNAMSVLRDAGVSELHSSVPFRPGTLGSAP